jgi:hypothetical protein
MSIGMIESARDHSVSMGKANVLAIALMAPIAAGLAALFVARWGWPLLDRGIADFFTLRVAIPVIIVGIFVHEVIHAIGWSLASGRPLRAIDMGFQLRSLSPYAHPRDPMQAGDYRIGAALPGLVLGILPALVAIVFGWPALLVVGILFTIAAGGDALVLWLIRGVPSDKSVADHPTRAGCVVID